MKRPLSSIRPIGPFSDTEPLDFSDPTGFIITYEMDTSELAGLFEEVEDNIADKLQISYGEKVTGVMVEKQSSSRVEVMVLLDAETFTQSEEQTIVESIKQELKRVSQTAVKLEKYKFEF